MVLYLCIVSYADTIHEACLNGNMEQVQSLLADNPDLINKSDDRGDYPLHIAAHEADTGMVRLLIDQGADLEVKNHFGYTPFLTAIDANSLEVVKLLVEAGVDQTVESQPFGKPIDLAFYTESRFGRSGITEYLISLGHEFDPDYVDFAGDARVFIASWFGHSDMLELLLNYHPNLQIVREENGVTPVSDAIQRDNVRSARLLIEHGADIYKPDRQGLPPIWYAVDMGMLETINLLLDRGAEVKTRQSATGQTLIHLAAKRGYTRIAERLLKAGCEVDARDDIGKTPLYFACKYGNRSVAELLLAAGADPAGCEEDNREPSPWLTDHPPHPGEAVAWILEHRGWGIKTSDHLLIIDDENRAVPRPDEPSLANGYYTAEQLANQDVVVLYTNCSSLPGENRYTHNLADSIKSIRYLDSDLDCRRRDSSVIYLKPGDIESYDGVMIKAFDPLQSPVLPILSYLIEVDDLNILFCGFSIDTAQAFRTAFDDALQGIDRLDFAIMAIPDPETIGSSDLKYVVDRAHPRAILLHSPNRDFMNYRRTADDILNWGTGTAVFAPANAGDSYHYVRE